MTIYHHDFRAFTENAPDIAEFEAFWRRVHDRLYRLVRRYDGADADEIVQETMLRCYEKWSILDPDRDPWPWVSVVAKRIATDHVRARTRREEVENANLPPAVDPTTPDDIVCTRELTETVHRALAALRDPDRTVISLHHFDGLPTAEIASLTGRTDGAVRQHLHRARNQLVVQLRRLTNGATGAFAPVALWLRRARQTVAGYVPVADALAVGLSVATAVSVGVVAGGALGADAVNSRTVDATAVSRSAPLFERPARLVAARASAGTRYTVRAARKPIAPRTALPPTSVPLLSGEGDPVLHPMDPSSNRITPVPGHPEWYVETNNETTPVVDKICWLAPDACPGT
jgi:RNA polymerase sigma-70 factor (ECF subfamily)